MTESVFKIRRLDFKAFGVDRAFRGRPIRMIAVAAPFGALSPFCSCGVIPIIAVLRAAG